MIPTLDELQSRFASLSGSRGDDDDPSPVMADPRTGEIVAEQPPQYPKVEHPPVVPQLGEAPYPLSAEAPFGQVVKPKYGLFGANSLVNLTPEQAQRAAELMSTGDSDQTTFDSLSARFESINGVPR